MKVFRTAPEPPSFLHTIPMNRACQRPVTRSTPRYAAICICPCAHWITGALTAIHKFATMNYELPLDGISLSPFACHLTVHESHSISESQQRGVRVCKEAQHSSRLGRCSCKWDPSPRDRQDHRLLRFMFRDYRCCRSGRPHGQQTQTRDLRRPPTTHDCVGSRGRRRDGLPDRRYTSARAPETTAGVCRRSPDPHESCLVWGRFKNKISATEHKGPVEALARKCV